MPNRMNSIRNIAALLFMCCVITPAASYAKKDADATTEWLSTVEHKQANNGDVAIHYAAAGSGPLVVFIHGFPDFWYSWRHQMQALDGEFRVVALDNRGYNRSDKPLGVENYAMPHLVADVASVIKAEGRDSAVVVGHDWGGAIAWNVAMSLPKMVDLLVILNLPHPNGLAREIATNPEQKANSQYAYNFQKENAHRALSAEGLAQWVKNPQDRARYEKAFKNSNFEAMLNYYKANYPSPDADTDSQSLPMVQSSVLMFHGLDDKALLPGGLNNTWEWLQKDLTLVTVPGAGHFVQADAADLVSNTMKSWLMQRKHQLVDATSLNSGK